MNILIAGRTSHDNLASNLNILRTAWISTDSYATRIRQIRAGVGSPTVALKRKANVINDEGDDDSLTGGNGTDWYFRALDDVIMEYWGLSVLQGNRVEKHDRELNGRRQF